MKSALKKLLSVSLKISVRVPSVSFVSKRFQRKAIFFMALTFLSNTVLSQQLVLTKDLQPDWQVIEGSTYKPYDEAQVNQTIYFSIDENQGVGDYLKIQCKAPASIFLNQQFFHELKAGSILYSIDSLRQARRERVLQFAIHQKEISAQKVSTKLFRRSLTAGTDVLQLKPGTSFRDVVIVAALVLLALLIAIIRLNPKLASDYFSVIKIFSLRESEDSQVYTRITSSGNFLFYGFSSLTIGFLLLILFQYQPDNFISRYDYTFSQLITQWVVLSGVVGAILMGKMVLIYVFATLFKLLDVTGFQFFNWVRLLFLLAGFIVSLLMAVTLLSPDATKLHQFFYGFCGWALIGWLILAFFKIAAKARIGLFHLFSYLCATEIIPSLILLKILYY
jgi:hypothetical protein